MYQRKNGKGLKPTSFHAPLNFGLGMGGLCVRQVVCGCPVQLNVQTFYLSC